MEQNVIFVFTGTGNSLQAARDIAAALPDCAVIRVRAGYAPGPLGGYARVGFVFPVYFLGLPRMMREFLSALRLMEGEEPYLFAVATCGRFPGNALGDADRLLRRGGHRLHFGRGLVMGDNAIAFYSPRNDPEALAAEYAGAMPEILSGIAERRRETVSAPNPLAELWYRARVRGVHRRDAGFRVAGGCTGCGLCGRVCPADNIRLEGEHPVFLHRCEQCMACIQYCPTAAISYRDKTGNRQRYRHPAIPAGELVP